MFKKWHRYLGIGTTLVLILFGFSGILLNHPEWIGAYKVPAALLPAQYMPERWDRSTMQSVVFPSVQHCLVGGKDGVWESLDGGRSFSRADGQGTFPLSHFGKTNHLLLDSLQGRKLVLASTYGGLYFRFTDQARWQRMPLPLDAHGKVVRTIRKGDAWWVVTDSEVFAVPAKDPGVHAPIPMQLHKPQGQQDISLIRAFFEIHAGTAWGDVGRFAMDMVALLLIFFSVSGLYVFYGKYHKKWTGRALPGLRFQFVWHRRLGWWLFVGLLVSAGTGLFMRPPLLVALWGREVSPASYASSPATPFAHSIRNAVYLSATDQLLLDTTEGFWISEPGDYARMRRHPIPVDVFVMGATVLEETPAGLLVGSFYGLYGYDPQSRRCWDLLEGRTAVYHGQIGKPGAVMVVGYFQAPWGDRYVASHNRGLLPLNAGARPIPMPQSLARDYGMPLWNYLFELHNLRLFEGFFGKFTILLTPLSALLLLVIILTGVYVEWKLRSRPKARKSEKPRQKVVR